MLFLISDFGQNQNVMNLDGKPIPLEQIPKFIIWTFLTTLFGNDLSVCTGKNYTIPNYVKQSPFYACSDYPDRQGASSISAAVISPPKSENRI
mgnify:CR=1 FL=1